MTEPTPDTLFAKARDRHANGLLHRDDIAIYDAHVAKWRADRAALAEANFPMQDGPTIPRSLAERIYFVYADLFGTDQTLERLGQRGGFSWAEIPVMRQQYYRKHGWLPDWSAALAASGEEGEG